MNLQVTTVVDLGGARDANGPGTGLGEGSDDACLQAHLPLPLSWSNLAQLQRTALLLQEGVVALQSMPGCSDKQLH